MKKPKKITIKFFINNGGEKFRPIIEGNRKLYPLYTQITYNRKNTQIKCHYAKSYYEGLEEVSEKDPYLLAFEERTFRKVMQYEIDRVGEENVELKGVGDKYHKYCISTHVLFDVYLKSRLKSEALQAKPRRFTEVIDYDKKTLKFDTILEASKKLFDNFSDILSEEFKEEMKMYRLYHSLYEKDLKSPDYRFPLVIDWLNGSHTQELGTKLKEVIGHDSNHIDKFMQTIHRLVLTRIEMVKNYM